MTNNLPTGCTDSMLADAFVEDFEIEAACEEAEVDPAKWEGLTPAAQDAILKPYFRRRLFC